VGSEQRTLPAGFSCFASRRPCIRLKRSDCPGTREGYSAMWQALSAAARSAIEQGRVEHGKVLWLLADACSMMLSPSSPNEPFKPFAVFHDRRSVILDDQPDIPTSRSLRKLLMRLTRRLKARLSDLLCLKSKPRNAYKLCWENQHS
jgi:hypothetical protein